MTLSFRRKTGTMYFRDIPRHLRDHFHSTCLKRGSTMRREFMRFMKRYNKKFGRINVEEAPMHKTTKKRKLNGHKVK